MVTKLGRYVKLKPLIFNHPFNFERLQAATDQEIAYAYGAGIDFWINNTPARTLVPEGGGSKSGGGAWDLHSNLDAYLASKHKVPCGRQKNGARKCHSLEARKPCAPGKKPSSHFPVKWASPLYMSHL